MKSTRSLFAVLFVVVGMAGCHGQDAPDRDTHPPLAVQPVTSIDMVKTILITATPATAPPAISIVEIEAAVAVDPPAIPPAPVEESTTHVVQAGDTLWGIAIAYGVSLEALRDANGIQDTNLIWVGQELIIPSSQADDTLAAIARERPSTTFPNLQVQRRPQANATSQSRTPITGLSELPNQVLLDGIRHDWQKMNNCGPTTVVMALSFYDVVLTQFDSAPALKGGPSDKNVSPHEMAGYIHDQDFGGLMRVNGNREILQRLVSNQIPVIVEQWLDRPGDELTGHYRLVRGYDDLTQEFIVNDSYAGPRIRIKYDEFERLWRAFNRLYIPVYKPEDEALVQSILGDNWDNAMMFERAVEAAKTEAWTVDDVYAWFNLGNSYLGLNDFERAAAAFDEALEIEWPARMLWYQFGPFEALNQTSQYQRVLDLSKPLTGFALEELHFQRGIAYEGLGQTAAALKEYERTVALNPRFSKASDALMRLRKAGNGS